MRIQWLKGNRTKKTRMNPECCNSFAVMLMNVWVIWKRRIQRDGSCRGLNWSDCFVASGSSVGYVSLSIILEFF